jgi:hypothetical protein
MAFAFLVAFAAIAGYAAQVAWLHWMTTPWWLLAALTLAAIIGVHAFRQRPGWLRGFGAGLLLILAAIQWLFITVLSPLPAYTGPVAIGQPFPAFRSILADETPVSESFLRGDTATLFVFFQGRW